MFADPVGAKAVVDYGKDGIGGRTPPMGREADMIGATGGGTPAVGGFAGLIYPYWLF
jgi:hypothetical protein